MLQVGLMRLDFSIRVGKFGEKELVLFVFVFLTRLWGF